jgi:hypothetical protein
MFFNCRGHHGFLLALLSAFCIVFQNLTAFSVQKSQTSARLLRRVPRLSMSDLLALDFDGVLCASSGESSYSSIIAARNFWPRVCTIADVSSREFQLVRSVGNHSYMSLIRARHLLILLLRAGCKHNEANR